LSDVMSPENDAQKDRLSSAGTHEKISPNRGESLAFSPAIG